jgi:hypothetical protein
LTNLQGKYERRGLAARRSALTLEREEHLKRDEIGGTCGTHGEVKSYNKIWSDDLNGNAIWKRRIFYENIKMLRKETWYVSLSWAHPVLVKVWLGHLASAVQ